MADRCVQHAVGHSLTICVLEFRKLLIKEAMQPKRAFGLCGFRVWDFGALGVSGLGV